MSGQALGLYPKTIAAFEGFIPGERHSQICVKAHSASYNSGASFNKLKDRP